MFRTKHVWILTSTAEGNTCGVLGVFYTEPEAQEFKQAAKVEGQITGWQIEKE